MPLRLPALLFCLTLAACGQAATPETAQRAAEVEPPVGSGPAADSPGADNPLAALTALAVPAAEGDRTVELLVTGLRADERVVELRLSGPNGEQVVGGPETIRHGNRIAGGAQAPRIGLTGSSSQGLGVTLSLDLFSQRPDLPPESPNALRAWARLALPDTADPAAWTASAVIENGYGDLQRLSDDDLQS